MSCYLLISPKILTLGLFFYSQQSKCRSPMITLKITSISICFLLFCNIKRYIKLHNQKTDTLSRLPDSLCILGPRYLWRAISCTYLQCSVIFHCILTMEPIFNAFFAKLMQYTVHFSHTFVIFSQVSFAFISSASNLALTWHIVWDLWTS